ncbi:uncharacterized protein LOC126794012 [Argentina anserina]|uniref:uncharacterized protein LOC126794012 n=1 Tax=Argentina anserina TaxID=57926 RepID=UPI0021763E30|nr:uncharacterized protein LOC126794012 [Potentilla anserina]
MDGDPTLVFKPVYKSFKFKTSEESIKGLNVEKNANLKDNNVFIANPDTTDPEVVKSPDADEQWKAAMDYDLPELVVFLQDSGYEFVKDICIDDGSVSSQNKCLEENCDLDLKFVSCMVSSDAESSSESTVESEDSSESSNSTVSKHIPVQAWEEDVEHLGNLTIEDGEHFGEKDCTVPTRAIWSDSVIFSSTDDNRRSKAALETALENARRGELFPLSVEFQSRNACKDGMSGSLAGSNKSQHEGKNARRKEEVPQSDSSNDWMSVSITGCSQSQQHRCENARREVWRLECHPQDSSEDEMSNSVTESSQSQQHLRGESCSSVSGPLARYSGALLSFGSISFGSNRSTTSSRSFTFPKLSTEWIGSPVRMVEADPTQLRRQRRWGMRYLCCSF